MRPLARFAENKAEIPRHTHHANASMVVPAHAESTRHAAETRCAAPEASRWLRPAWQSLRLH